MRAPQMIGEVNSMPPHGPHGPHGAGRKEKPKNASKTLRRLVARLKPFIPLLVIVFVFTVAGTLCNTVSPLVLGQATTEVFSAFERVMAGTGGLDFIAFNRVLLTLVLLYVAYSICQFICQFIMAKVTQEVIYGLRRDMKEKLDRVPLSYYDGRPKGEILSRVTNDVDLISSTLQETLVQIISAVVTLVSVVIFMFSISWILALVAFATLPLSLLATVGIATRSQRYFKSQQKALGKLNAHIEEMYSGNTEVKSFTREDAAIDEFNARNGEYFAQAWKAQFLGRRDPSRYGLHWQLGLRARLHHRRRALHHWRDRHGRRDPGVRAVHASVHDAHHADRFDRQHHPGHACRIRARLRGA